MGLLGGFLGILKDSLRKYASNQRRFVHLKKKKVCKNFTGFLSEKSDHDPNSVHFPGSGSDLAPKVPAPAVSGYTTFVFKSAVV
jgi:hypothetical protein